MDADRRRDVGLFRYSIVCELAAMSARARGRAVRELAGRELLTPWGERVSVSRVTLDRWRGQRSIRNARSDPRRHRGSGPSGSARSPGLLRSTATPTSTFLPF